MAKETLYAVLRGGPLHATCLALDPDVTSVTQPFTDRGGSHEIPYDRTEERVTDHLGCVRVVFVCRDPNG